MHARVTPTTASPEIVFLRPTLTPKRLLPALRLEASIHSEGDRGQRPLGIPTGPRPSGADGGDACAGADFRGGLSSVLIWLPAEAERHAGVGNITPAECARRQSRP